MRDDKFGVIMANIQWECYKNNGASFSMAFDRFSLPRVFTKVFIGKKKFFSCKWEYVETRDDSFFCEDKKILSQLPEGVTYTKKTVCKKALPSSVIESGHAFEEYEERYTLFISEMYSKKVFSDFINNSYVVSKKFNQEIVDQAEKFKNKIKLSHPEVIEPLFKYGLQRCSSLTKDGFTDFDKVGYFFDNVGMKPLISLEQVLGLAMAIADYGASFIDANMVYFIDSNGSPDSVNLMCCERTYKEKTTGLKDW